MTRKKFILMLGVIYAASGYECFREYYTTGHLSGVTIFSSAMAAVMGTTIACIIGWHANKPEK